MSVGRDMPAARYAPAGRDGIHIISHANEASAYRICAANISHGASRISQKGNNMEDRTIKELAVDLTVEVN